MKVIYTCILGDYDTLKEPLVYTPGWKYVCYTDQDFESDVWNIVKIEGNQRDQREIKLDPFSIDSIDVELSIWVDGSIQINCDLDAFVEEYHKSDFSVMRHPTRTCVYEEAEACLSLRRGDPEEIIKQIDRYKASRFPVHSGMVATGIIIRNHTKEVEGFCTEWSNELMKGSVRDQLSFNYTAKRLDFDFTMFPFAVLANKMRLNKHKHE